MSFANNKRPYTAIPYPTITVLILALAHTFDLTYDEINAPQLLVTQRFNTSDKKSSARARKRESRASNYNVAARKRMSRTSKIQTRRTRNNNVIINKQRTNPLATTPIQWHKGNNTTLTRRSSPSSQIQHTDYERARSNTISSIPNLKLMSIPNLKLMHSASSTVNVIWTAFVSSNNTPKANIFFSRRDYDTQIFIHTSKGTHR